MSYESLSEDNTSCEEEIINKRYNKKQIIKETNKISLTRPMPIIIPEPIINKIPIITKTPIITKPSIINAVRPPNIPKHSVSSMPVKVVSNIPSKTIPTKPSTPPQPIINYQRKIPVLSSTTLLLLRR
jgi:hypothetical protein